MSGTREHLRFRGRAIAVAVEDVARAPESTWYLVEDLDRDTSMWVHAADIERSAAIAPGEPVIGYVAVPAAGGAQARRAGIRAIRRICEQAEWPLVRVVRDRRSGPAVERPALVRALERIARGEARAMVVCDVEPGSRFDDDLADVMDGVRRAGGHLVAVEAAPPEPGPARRRRVGNRTAAIARAAVVERITEMRAAGMAPRAIADALNDEGVPSPGKAGSRWRPWTVREVGGAWPPRGPKAPSRGRASSRNA